MNRFDREACTWDDDPTRIERAFRIAEAIKKFIPLTLTMTALEYGCGTGLLGFELHRYLGKMWMADSSKGMLSVLKEKISRFAIANMIPIELDLLKEHPPIAQIDLVATMMVLHHIRDTEKIIHAFAYLLKPGGHLCIADLLKEDGSFHGPGFEGQNGFDPEELLNLLGKEGFSPVANEIVFSIPRKVGEETRNYPVFLLIAKKA